MKNFEDYKDIIKFILESYEQRNKYLNEIDLIDTNITNLLIDNKYTESIQIVLDKLTTHCFGEKLNNELDWYMFNKQVDDIAEIKFNDKTYNIRNVEDFLLYLEDNFEYF